MAALLDTSTVSHYLQSGAPERTPVLVRRMKELLARERPAIAAISYFEFQAGIRKLLARKEGFRKSIALQLFYSQVDIVGLDAGNWQGWNVAADLKVATQMRGLTMSDSDLLIAATAHYSARELFTSDKTLAGHARLAGIAATYWAIE